MKRYIVLFCFICIAFGEWHQTREITLPKGIQVNDLSISNSGELWILSTSSILKYEVASDNPFLIQEFSNGKVLAVQGSKVYVIDQSNRFFAFDANDQSLQTPVGISLTNPQYIKTIGADDQTFIFIQGLNQITFLQDTELLGSITASIERFTVIPLGDYTAPETPFYTLAQNRIFAWTGGSMQNLQTYQKKEIFSAAHSIFDITADRSENIYALFADSVVVLESNGTYKTTIMIDKTPMRSSIYYNPANDNLLIFNRHVKNIKVLSNVNKYNNGELITLHSNQPNPVDNYTEIEFTLNQPLDLTLTVYNLIGEPVKVIAQGRYTKGTHRIIWRAVDESGSQVPNGIYFYRLESNKGVAIRQLTVLR